jgi:8-oxo-dGTP pyrophosphatase MutT (NUDIX family)
MTSQELLDEIRNLSNQEKRDLTYERLVEIINQLSPDEIIELSNIIGYPVFTRLCMNELKHKFVLLQDGAAAIIVNDKGQILLQSRTDNERWGLPGGCQELGERFEETVIREVKEETNLEITEDNLELIGIIAGGTRRKEYPNGDVVINNTALYCVKNYKGEVKWDSESKDMRFFDLDKLPENQHDPDLVEAYIKFINK